MTTSFERILWAIAGAERHILEKCRTDYKRFSAIGATILMTSFIAFCAGTAAAWFFTQKGDDTSGSLGWSVCFGIVWALLIFCIDRSLVITLKKDPTLKHQKFWVPLLSRSALACIIAFMVSIPLELVIFEDFIAEKKFFFNEDSANTLSKSSRAYKEENALNSEIMLSTQVMARLDSIGKDLNNTIDYLDNQISVERSRLDKPTTQSFVNAKKQYDNYSAQLSRARRNLQYSTNKQDSNRYSLEINRLINARSPHWNTMVREKNAWNLSINNRIEELTEQKNTTNDKINQNSLDYDNENERLNKNRNSKDTLSNKRKILIGTFQETANNGNHFIKNFRILEYAVWSRDAEGNLPTELYFLWLIRLLFFIVEILPTVVKIVTPVGSYDRMVYAEEQAIKEYVNSGEFKESIFRIQQFKQNERENTIKYQTEAELKIRNEIARQIELAQVDVSKTYIERWKEKELKKIESMHNENSGNLNEV
jgi:hypothetical protein